MNPAESGNQQEVVSEEVVIQTDSVPYGSGLEITPLILYASVADVPFLLKLNSTMETLRNIRGISTKVSLLTNLTGSVVLICC